MKKSENNNKKQNNAKQEALKYIIYRQTTIGLHKYLNIGAPHPTLG